MMKKRNKTIIVMKLDEEKKELLRSVERGEWKPLKNAKYVITDY